MEEKQFLVVIVAIGALVLTAFLFFGCTHS
jgi:hypothetical protein